MECGLDTTCFFSVKPTDIFYPTNNSMRFSDYSISSATTLFFCVKTDISAANWHESLHGGRVELRPESVFCPFGGDIFRGLQMQGQKELRVDHFWPRFSDTEFCLLTENISKMISWTVIRQLMLNVSLTRAF